MPITLPRRLKAWVGIPALAGLLSGCGPTRFHHFTNSFLAPTPPPDEPLAAHAPPDLPPPDLPTQLRLAPRLPATQQGSAPSGWTAVVIREADWHFQAGKKAYQEGDLELAREQFDRAIDILLAPHEQEDKLDRGQIERRLGELAQAIYKYDLAGLGAAAAPGEGDFPRSPLDDIPSLTFPVDPEMKSRILEEVRATASQLPLEATDAVLSYIRYFSSGRGRRILLEGLRRAGRYWPLIQRILREEGLPQELIHVAQAESGFMPRALSRKRAAGLWQFMKARGNQYGLMQTSHTDDRLDPEKATRAAARHLKDLYNQFGDWYLALAAYNAGPGVVERAVERTGYADFWELRRRNVLPKETSNYVPVILAMTIMTKNAGAHGLEDIPQEPAMQHDSVEIKAPTDLSLVADLLDCPVSELRELNPALLKDLAPAGYSLRVPKGAGGTLEELLASLPPERRVGWRAHRAADGETLAAIARRYRVPEGSITAANGDLKDGLQAGDLLLIPAKAASTRAAPTRRASAGSRVNRRPQRVSRSAARPSKQTYRTASLRAPGKTGSSVKR